MSQSISKPVKISPEYYTERLLPKAITYRNRMLREIKFVGPKNLYTEKRSHGMRTKFWNVGPKFPVSKMKSFIKAHKTLQVGHMFFNVELRETVTNTIYKTRSIEVHFTHTNNIQLK